MRNVATLRVLCCTLGCIKERGETDGVSIVILQVKSCESDCSFQKAINYSVEYFIYLEISGITLYMNLYLFFCSISLSTKYLKNNLLPLLRLNPNLNHYNTLYFMLSMIIQS